MLHKQVSFIVDSKGVKQAAVVPIDIYNELMTLQRPSPTTSRGARALPLQRQGAEAHGYPVGKRQNPVSWSRRAPPPTARMRPPLREAVIELRQELLGKGCSFPTPKGLHLYRRSALQQPEPGREPGGGQQPKRAGCLAKQRRLHPQAIGFWQEDLLMTGPGSGLAHVCLRARGGPLIRMTRRAASLCAASLNARRLPGDAAMSGLLRLVPGRPCSVPPPLRATSPSI